VTPPLDPDAERYLLGLRPTADKEPHLPQTNSVPSQYFEPWRDAFAHSLAARVGGRLNGRHLIPKVVG
jgi:hypothetical protein